MKEKSSNITPGHALKIRDIQQNWKVGSARHMLTCDLSDISNKMFSALIH